MIPLNRFRTYRCLVFGNRLSSTRILLCLRVVCSLGALLIAKRGEAARGDIVTQYDFAASAFAMSPTQPYMYATIPSLNSVAIINTNTLAVDTVFVGSGPAGIALSPDGLTAYIANSSSSFVVVFNTQTRTVTNSLLIPEQPQDVVVGNQNRLFVLGTNSIFQIDATTGASAGPNIGEYYIVYSGALEISPDRNSLYYGDYGLSPSSMYKFNVSTPTATLLWESPHGPHGSNGQDLTLSHDGSFISYACGYGQGGYKIAKFRTSDMASLGTFDTDAYPREIAFSPDDQVAYTVHTSGQIDVFDTNTFLSLGPILAADEANELSVDATGKYLFASYTDTFGGGFTGIRVFDTGRVAPPSPAGRGDFNGDGFLDYVLYNSSTRRTVIWYLHGNTLSSSAYGPIIPAGWTLAAVADVNRNGKPDFVLYNANTRQTAIWFLNNAALVSTAYGPALPADWTLNATADFNSDGRPDYVLYNARTGETTIWYLDGTTLTGSAVGPTLPSGWTLRDALDFNANSKPDYLLLNNITRKTALWYLDGATYVTGAYGLTVPSGWSLQGAGDFNANGKPDYVLFEGNTRRTALWYLNGVTRTGSAYGPTLAAGYSLASP